MNDKGKQMQEELTHFRMCQSIIRGNITRYDQEYAARHAQVQELYKAINSGDVELYNQLMTTASLEEQAASGLRKNTAALEKPYFGRIDYLDGQIQREERVYIGKNGVFQNKTDVLIADWRAPISSVYYENELGFGGYGLPDETQAPIDLKLKRTYDVSQGQLNGYYDSDVASNDELLVKYLSKNKDVVLGEIIATIQKEQNSIIRESPFANLIVQGVAGSGKTTVAMHRISYLLYNYKERFESNEFCIVGSSDLLLNYITSGLPELDVPNIKHMRMDQLFTRLCEKDWTKRHTVIPPDETARLRCSLSFMQELELFLMNKREELVDCRELADDTIGTILTQSSNLTLLRENPRFSVTRLLTTMDERIKTRIKFLMSGGDREELQAKLKQYAGHYKALRPKASVFDFYQEFLTSWAESHGYLTGLPAQDSDRSAAVQGQPAQISGRDAAQSQPAQSSGRDAAAQGQPVLSPMAVHLNSCGKKQYDLYDIAALALVHYRMTQSAPNEEFGLLFLDEAQDFGMSIYYVLKTILPDTYFTIMGDVSQNINYDTGINDWYDLTKLFLTGPRDKFLLLQKSYRNTIEISEYAGKILEKASSGRYKITPVIRHGIPVQEENFWCETEIAERCAGLIDQLRQKGYATTAVICSTEEDARRVRLLLGRDTPLADGEAENFSAGTMVLPIRLVKGLEFDTVILWNPYMKHGLERPDQSKLLYVAATRALHELYVFTC